MEINITQNIEKLAEKYPYDLQQNIDLRVKEMQNDDKSHYLIYYVLGITESEGENIDLYQNKGRFLYKYAVPFLEQLGLYLS